MIITQTPLRVSFAGGGTDLAAYYTQREGYVVSAGIDKSAFVIVTERYDEKIYVNYSQKEIVDSVDQIQHELVREAMKMTGVERGVEVTMLSDIPSQGSGLGSSSSITVGLLNAFHVFAGEQVGPARLAEEACQIEIEHCKKPIGKQDQYIAAFGGLMAFRFGKDGSVDSERIRLSAAQNRQLASGLFMFYTDQTRKADNILEVQKEKTDINIEFLDGIKALGLQAKEALLKGNFDRIGELLSENWELKKQLADKISNDRIDDMHRKAMQSGALGAKICGAGGGGFLMAYCHPAAHRQLLHGMREYRWMPINVEPDGSKVIFNYRRASSWK